MSSFFLYLIITLFILVCLFLILLVLIQKGRGGGLSGAFGGAGGNTAFGSKTGDVLTWATSIVFGVFLLLAVALNLMANHKNEELNNPNVASETPLLPEGTSGAGGGTDEGVAPTSPLSETREMPTEPGGTSGPGPNDGAAPQATEAPAPSTQPAGQ